jgi:hypothetical protein
LQPSVGLSRPTARARNCAARVCVGLESPTYDGSQKPAREANPPNPARGSNPPRRFRQTLRLGKLFRCFRRRFCQNTTIQAIIRIRDRGALAPRYPASRNGAVGRFSTFKGSLHEQ